MSASANSSSAGDEERSSAAPRVLVVDDDREIRQLLTGFLKGHGYSVVTASDGRTLYDALTSQHIDIIILDVLLPGADGIDLCRGIRASYSVPIIMLTAKREETDRIVGLEVGADDYLSKPFNPRELLARIKAVLRRTVSPPGSVRPRSNRTIEFEGWRVDMLEILRQVLRKRQTVPPAPCSAKADMPVQVGTFSDALTARQRDVLSCVEQGLSNKEIARSLNIAPGTVKIHLAALFSHFGSRNRTELAIKTRRDR